MIRLGPLEGLVPIDLKMVGRDSLLRWMVALPLALALLARWGTPPLFEWLQQQYQFDASRYNPLLLSWLLLATPSLYGAVIGFLILDERDDQTLKALQITPLTLKGYLMYRIAGPLVLGFLMSMAILPISGLVEMGFKEMLLASVAASPLAAVYTLFLAAFANNKVQGFALMKAAGVLAWPPIFAYFIDSPWQLSFGVVPTYWPAKLLWVLIAGGKDAWAYLIAGLTLQAFVIRVLLSRFQKVMHSS